MKKYIIKTILLIATIASLTISCSDNFVEREPVYTLSSENYFNSKEDYYNALVSTYAMFSDVMSL